MTEREKQLAQALREIVLWPGPPPGGWTDADINKIRDHASIALDPTLCAIFEEAEREDAAQDHLENMQEMSDELIAQGKAPLLPGYNSER
jgi:hypothetical protein